MDSHSNSNLLYSFIHYLFIQILLCLMLIHFLVVACLLFSLKKCCCFLFLFFKCSFACWRVRKDSALATCFIVRGEKKVSANEHDT